MAWKLIKMSTAMFILAKIVERKSNKANHRKVKATHGTMILKNRSSINLRFIRYWIKRATDKVPLMVFSMIKYSLMATTLKTGVKQLIKSEINEKNKLRLRFRGKSWSLELIKSRIRLNNQNLTLVLLKENQVEI